MDDGVADDKLVEVRFLAPAEHVAVIDAIACAANSDRASEMKRMLREVAEREIHRATVVLRVLRVNPLAADERGGGGKGGGR